MRCTSVEDGTTEPYRRLALVVYCITGITVGQRSMTEV